MKIYLLILLTIGRLFSASLEHITINNYDFSIVKEDYHIYDSKGKIMKMYLEENNNNLTFVLRLTLHDETGGCTSRSIQKGAYEINGSVITLYNYWDRKGKAYLAPYGWRIQKYKVLSSGKLKQIFGQIYLESTKQSYENDSGLKYLFTSPKTDEERAKKEEYIKEIEQKYKAKFVLGKEKNRLKEEVEEALKRKLKRVWRGDK
ncbi:hypothetical protein MNB_SV-14-1770 [hydrothermal vent metagenome]|uniref:Uncharacterized protein n=1 Tax=hydrothermal vent metagenome TaxID=652676 RepID=A0A1W1BK20_9ZZZZ